MSKALKLLGAGILKERRGRQSTPGWVAVLTVLQMVAANGRFPMNVAQRAITNLSEEPGNDFAVLLTKVPWSSVSGKAVTAT